MANAAQWYQLSGLVSHSAASGMTVNAVAGTITVVTQGDYECQFDDSFASDKNGIVDGAVFVDGAESTVSWVRTISGTQVGSVSQGDILPLTAGQVITIWAKSSAASTSLVHERIGFRAKRLGQ